MHLNAFIILFIKVENGKVDGERLCITGRSAGGYTTLASLAFRNTFKAGASLYGVSFNLLEFYLFLYCHMHTPNVFH
jgi:dipeptidyl aminopeptidase/acylaminoacyl peptidase